MFIRTAFLDRTHVTFEWKIEKLQNSKINMEKQIIIYFPLNFIRLSIYGL